VATSRHESDEPHARPRGSRREFAASQRAGASRVGPSSSAWRASSRSSPPSRWCSPWWSCATAGTTTWSRPARPLISDVARAPPPHARGRDCVPRAESRLGSSGARTKGTSSPPTRARARSTPSSRVHALRPWPLRRSRALHAAAARWRSDDPLSPARRAPRSRARGRLAKVRVATARRGGTRDSVERAGARRSAATTSPSYAPRAARASIRRAARSLRPTA